MEHKSKCVNWCSLPAQYISENSEIAHDITFKFMDGEVSANKTILAMVNKVFRNMFFVHDTTDKTAKEIIMEGEGITKTAFKIMINAMYNAKSIKESLQSSSVPEMFAVLYLVTKYEMPDLVLAVKDSLSLLNITEDTVLDIAGDAMEYLATFEEDAQNVLMSCAKFLRTKLTDYKSLLGYVAANSDKSTAVHKLLVLMDDIPPPVCRNCNFEQCRHGVGVEKSQVRVGLKVAANPAASRGPGKMWHSKLIDLQGEVLELEDEDDNEVKFKCSFTLQGSEKEFDREYNYKIVQYGELRFVFHCK